jgi:hypothetical protein
MRTFLPVLTALTLLGCGDTKLMEQHCQTMRAALEGSCTPDSYSSEVRMLEQGCTANVGVSVDKKKLAGFMEDAANAVKEKNCVAGKIAAQRLGELGTRAAKK